jgi:hypothetical protein
MILISHRGNIEGKNLELENNPFHIDKIISLGYDVELDVRLINDRWYLGHDEGQYSIQIEWMINRSKNIWVHCKNINSIEFLISKKIDLNFFWHQNDDLTLTSKNFIWSFPGKQPIKNSISVMPEIHNEDISHCCGICSDFIINYKK